ncbi:MAG: RNA polymerase subunit sigma-70 [Planctomycetaceae bacterium]|jgi:RNA polymerase sigma-70 factor (ECF subfamily)|nr:RNA polymerase subunit sigma-70 [Planctomycetaceae bacterium]
MSDQLRRQDRNLEDCRDYLQLLAQLQMDRALQGKIDVSGVVQQTMLANNLADEIRKLKTGKRDVSRERSLDAALQQSSNRLEAWLAAEQSSPSGLARRQEQTLLLSAALAKLPEAQRDALMLRHFYGRSLAQIAEHLGRSHAAVAGLLKRGLQQLRDQLRDLE